MIRSSVSASASPARVTAPRLLASAGAAALLALAGSVITLPSLAFAQNAAAQAQRPSDGDLLGDFIHYVKIARFDLAQAMGAELLSRKPAADQFVTIVEAADVARFEDAVTRGMRVQSLEPVATELNKLFEDGMRARSRNPEQIQQSIQQLTGNLRARLMARERLLAAGEYAMPQLLAALMDRTDPARRAEVQRVLVESGRNAVIPLSTALLGMPPAQQEVVADVLGLIPYRASVPFLADVLGSTQSDQVREACRRALERLGGADGDTPALYLSLAEAYYGNQSDVTSFPGETHQLLWSYDPAGGLMMAAIRSEVYHEAMAMRLAERAMQIQSGSGGPTPEALALWVASNYSRQIDTPEGYVNPAYPMQGRLMPGQTARRPAEYFGVAAGADVAQRVLERGLDTRHTRLVRLALAAVERTAGSSSLASGAASPMGSALTYPDRRVQLDAALAIAAARPAASFPSSDRVVPTLASSLQGLTNRTAVVLVSDAEVYQSMRSLLEGAGYIVLPRGSNLAEVPAMAEAASIDLVVVVQNNAERVPAALEEIRGNARSAATPVMVISSPESSAALRRRYESDITVAVRPTGLTNAQVTTAISDLVERASGGPIEEGEAAGYRDRALSALRDLAVSGSSVLNVGDASAQLIAAMADASETNRFRIAEILSMVNQARAQRAVMDSAINASGSERVELLGLVAASSRRFGNQLEPRQIARVVEFASSGDDAEATAAAALMGALALPNAELLPLISKR